MNHLSLSSLGDSSTFPFQISLTASHSPFFPPSIYLLFFLVFIYLYIFIYVYKYFILIYRNKSTSGSPRLSCVDSAAVVWTLTTLTTSFSGAIQGLGRRPAPLPHLSIASISLLYRYHQSNDWNRMAVGGRRREEAGGTGGPGQEESSGRHIRNNDIFAHRGHRPRYPNPPPPPSPPPPMGIAKCHTRVAAINGTDDP